TETDYLLTSATELWTLSCDTTMSGKLLMSQYRLNGSPATSATLLSTKSLGDSLSYGMSLIRLKSGALLAGWNEFNWTTYSSINLNTGIAYPTPSGAWSVKLPGTVPNASYGNTAKTQTSRAQPPT